MAEIASRPLGPGDTAPDITLPAVHRDGTISLADFRGQSPLMLAIFRGLYCPFCRRAVAQFGTARDKLRAAGIESLAVVATELDNARLYFKYRPSSVPIVADPALVAHRAFGLPPQAMTEQMAQAVATAKVNPTGELPGPTPYFDAMETLQKKDGFVACEADERDRVRQGALLCGQFLLDATGVVRWANIECGEEGFSGLGKFPTEGQLLGATRALA